MKSIRIVTTQEVGISPQIMAQVFSEMFDYDQREFFEELAKLWHGDALSYQIYNVKHNGPISKEALEIMREFGD